MANDDTLQKQLMIDVEDSLRHEQMMKAWKEYGPSLIAGIVLAVLLSGTISAWRAWQNRSYENATAILATSLEQPDADSAVEKASDDLPTAHRAIGTLVTAGTALRENKPDEAQRILETALAGKKMAEPYASLARITAIELAFDKPKAEGRPTQDWLQTLSKIGHDKANPWRYHAEILAALITAHDLEDYTQARKWLAPSLLDEDVAPSLKERATALDSLYAIKAKKE